MSSVPEVATRERSSRRPVNRSRSAVPESIEVTTLPPESSTLTTGWVARAAPLCSVVPRARW